MKKFFIGCLSILALSGCTVRMADMTVGSTKNFDLNNGNLTIGERVIAEDTYPVFIFPLGIPSMETAIDKAIENDKCAVGLSNLVITQLNHSFLLGSVGIRAEGNLIIDKNQPGCAE